MRGGSSPLVFALAALGACASREAPPPPATEAVAEPPVVTEVSADELGHRVRLRGMAIDRKGGAVLAVGEHHVWIEGLHSWPAGYYEGGDRGRELTVTGVLHEDHGLPVFVPKEGEPVVQGIPVPEGTDLEQASRRYVLRDASW
ncbi:MAG: hypothetical protein KDK70_10370 [Myxococcales bacterium]|nr:hypothetical protein [Myxococcales bacterium]